MPTRLHSEILIAVDVGNSRAKWGRFVDGRLVDTASLPLGDPAAYDEQATRWELAPSTADRESSSDIRHSSFVIRHSPVWSLATVNPDGSQPLLDWLARRVFAPALILNDPAMLPLPVELEKPAAVGIDRLLNAVAVNARRQPGRAAVIVDCGSAITVDAVSREGAYRGGSIAAGLGLSARGLHEFTYSLPLVDIAAAPAALGQSTEAAMRSGLFWGTVGAVKELVHRIARSLDLTAAVYLTGGDAGLLAPHLDLPAELVPDLTLHGIYLATQHVRR